MKRLRRSRCGGSLCRVIIFFASPLSQPLVLLEEQKVTVGLPGFRMMSWIYPLHDDDVVILVDSMTAGRAKSIDQVDQKKLAIALKE
jgi:hypothetical protein